MGIAQSLTAIVLGMAAPVVHASPTSDGSALQAVSAACAGATAPANAQAMYCGVNVVRHAYGLPALHANAALNHSAALKAQAVRRCGFTHTPCGMPFRRTFQSARYHARSFGENLAWGQGGFGTPVSTLGMWLGSAGHRANLLGRWRDVGIAELQGTMFGNGDVTLWVMQFGRRR